MKKKVLFPITILSLMLTAAACNASEPLGGSSFESESTSETPSSSENSQRSSESQVPNSSSNSSLISSNKSSEQVSSNKSSVQSSSSASSAPIQQSYVPDNYELQSDPKTCDEHELIDTIVRPATLLNKGVVRHECEKCHGFNEEFFYDLDEFAFENQTFAYDGNERTLRIAGTLPYGCTVKYENNKLTEIGQKEATANIFDENNKLLASKKATISIVENKGFPNVRITTGTGQDPDYKEKTNYTDATVTVDNCDSKYLINEAVAGIRVRGNSTNQASVPKRAWRIKFNKKTNMLGLNGGEKMKNWVLLADFFDSSMFRNASAFTIGDSLFNYSGTNYCTDRQHVNVYMNGENRGVYLLAEQQKAEKNRIPINEATEDYTGNDIGFLLEIDGLISQGQSDEEYTFTTGNSSQGGQGGSGGSGGSGQGERVNGVTVTDKSYAVKTDCYSQDQVTFIKKYVDNVLTIFKNAVKGEKLQVLDENNNLIDSPYATQYETLNSVIDIDSVFKTYVLQEFMKNYDCGWGSFYLYVDFSAKSTVKRLTLGAPWDFDLGEGNKQSGDGVKTNDDFLNGKYTGFTEFNPWLYLLSQTDFFNDMFTKYYSIFYNSGMYERMVEYIQYETSAFKENFDFTYTKWDLKNATNSGMSTRRGYETHQDAVNYLLKWYSERKTYLDSKYLK